MTYHGERQSGAAGRQSGADTGSAATSGLILLAEDNSVLQLIAKKQLQRLGLTVHTVADGNAAIAAMSSENYALILMDCQMPSMDGFEATQAIRKIEAETGKHIPIIAMTASAMIGDKEKCLAAGMDDYISKPVALDQLKLKIERWLSRQTTA